MNGGIKCKLRQTQKDNVSIYIKYLKIVKLIEVKNRMVVVGGGEEKMGSC
jgi:hypothetical protein